MRSYLGAMLAVALAVLGAGEAQAQEEIVVTGSRVRSDTSAAQNAGIGIRRRADFAV